MYTKNIGSPGNVVFETLHDFYRTAIVYYIVKGDVPSTNFGTEKLVLEYHRFGTGVSKA